MRKLIKREHAAAVAIALLTAGLGSALHMFSMGQTLIDLSYDFLMSMQGDRPVDEAVIVYLDEKSHRELNQPLNAPWDRKLHARLIDRLTAAGAKAIAFDVVFSDEGVKPGDDGILAKSIKSSDRVVLAADRIRVGPGGGQVLLPIDPFFTNAAGIGSAEVRADADLVVRQHTPDEELAGFTLPGLSWATAEFLKTPATTNNAVRNQRRWMDYYGRPGIIPWRSYSDALDPAVVPDQFFRGKTVFVGARIFTRYAGERKDEYRNPFGLFMTRKESEESGALFVPGVEIQTTACLNLMRGDWWTRLSDAKERSVMVAIGALVGFVLASLRPLRATIFAVVALGVLYSACHVAANHLIWFPIILAAIQIIFAFVVSASYNSIQSYVQNRLTKQMLSLYLPPPLVEKYLANPKFLKPGAEKQVVTLFFSDIADFTRMSEGLDSDTLAHLMNTYFETAVSHCVHKTDGTLVKYLGDSIFAFWNAPDSQADHSLRACEAALHFRQVRINSPNGSLLHTRVGIHTGDANVGNFGSAERVDYTALGENVNLASRMEGLNKYLGTERLISGATKAGVGDRLVTRPLGSFYLKGFEKPVEVFELVGWPDEAEASHPWREAFAQALKNYQSGDFVLAEMGFNKTLELKPNDGPSKYYLSRLEELRQQPLPEDWTGATIMKEK